MSEQDNVKVVQASYAALNAHDLDKYDRLLTVDYKAEGTGAPDPMNTAQNRLLLQGFLTAFPDLHFDVTRTIAQNDAVVAHWSGTGSHTGPLSTPTGASIPATGKKAVVRGTSTFDLKNDRITRSWTYWDMTSLLGQLGVMPPV